MGISFSFVHKNLILIEMLWFECYIFMGLTVINPLGVG